MCSIVLEVAKVLSRIGLDLNLLEIDFDRDCILTGNLDRM